MPPGTRDANESFDVRSCSMFTQLCDDRMLGQLLDSSLIRVHGSLPKPSARKACSETVVRLPFTRGASILRPWSTRVCRHPQTPGARIPVLGVTHQILRTFSSSVSVAAEVPGRFTARHVSIPNHGCWSVNVMTRCLYWVVSRPWRNITEYLTKRWIFCSRTWRR